MVHKVRDDITEVRAGLAEKFVMLVGKITGLERRIESLESNGGGGDTRIKNEVHELRSKVRDNTTECAHLRETNMSLERQLREKISIIERLHSRMDQMDESQQAIQSYNGTLLWKIESYQRKRQDAINGVKTALYSPPFYSAQFGYKMCAKIYMNGDGFGKGSHLSLFFVVMRGEMITYTNNFVVLIHLINCLTHVCFLSLDIKFLGPLHVKCQNKSKI